ncbi:MAG: hypothetical protein JSV88_28695 [Candidatus Aminicenantes bacterium]|nr:MAG: hypothetical protein JSV88_28695 [Candidatus Aminicenantes bacterium]
MNNTFKFFKWSVVVMVIVAFLVIVVWSPPVGARKDKESGRVYQFKKNKGITITILPRAEFNKRFASMPGVRKTRDSVLRYAREVYSPAGRELINEECGEEAYGKLFLSLANPDITDATRDEVDTIIDLDTPSLPRRYTSGHFKFYYTDKHTNPDHNVTLAEIQATATVLNDAWNDFATNFTVPKHYVTGGGCDPQQKMVNVKVYYLGSSLYGATGSSWNYIKLNSKHVVKDSCKRQTTSVHELFHRVQYSYGYVSGMANMKWAVEGTASWSQKYRADDVGDWMRRMDQGLDYPDLKLISGRAYNACHFWVYLGQRTQGEAETMKKVWSTYKVNGKDMKQAVITTIQDRVPNCANMDQFVGWWLFANFYKDLSNAKPEFDYEEDEWTRDCGGLGPTYGPLAQVRRTTNSLNVGSNLTRNGIVTPYGADYWVFNIGNTVTGIEIKCTTTSNNFGYAVIAIKNNAVESYLRTEAGGEKDYNYTKTVSPGQYSQVAFIVIGNPDGGNYSINARGS